MNYNEIKIKVDLKYLETATAICQMVVPYGLYIEDYSDVETSAIFMAPELIDKELLKKDKTCGIIHIYIEENQNPSEAVAFIEDRLNSQNIPFKHESSIVNEEDYATSWKKYYHPLRVGKNIMVVPTWEDFVPLQSDVVVELDPGMAFGTGTHETTRLCMVLLEKYINESSNVLDIGCGSGILAVTSILLGGKNAVGCDIDPIAVKVSKENAELNNVSDKTEFILSDLTTGISGKFKVVCANIVADVVIQLSGNVSKFLDDDGIFLCSGIIDTRQDDVESALINNGFKIVDTIVDGGWVAFACVR